MKPNSTRRQFLRTSAITGCALFLSGKFSTASGFSHLQDEIPDPKKINYCSYTYPKDCQFLEASLKK